jgi:hypothetical protein
MGVFCTSRFGVAALVADSPAAICRQVLLGIKDATTNTLISGIRKATFNRRNNVLATNLTRSCRKI